MIGPRRPPGGRTGRRSMPGTYRVVAAILAPVVRALVRRSYRGLEHVPPEGPALVCVNHIGAFDPLCFALALWDNDTPALFLGKAGIVRAPVVGPILRSAGIVPVDRETSRADEAFGAAVTLLRRGRVSETQEVRVSKLAAIAISVLAMGLGILASLKPGGTVDRIALMLAVLGQAIPSMPVLVIQGVHDRIVDVGDVDGLVRRYTEGGATVRYHRDPLAEHLLLYPFAVPMSLRWLGNRLEREHRGGRSTWPAVLDTGTYRDLAGVLPGLARRRR